MSKMNYYFKPQSFGVICYIAVNKQNSYYAYTSQVVLTQVIWLQSTYA